MEHLVGIFVLCVLGLGGGFAFPFPKSRGSDYPLRLQPEFDSIDISGYLKNEKLVRLAVNCVIFDGPCDSVGQWIKPRVEAGLLGECLQCTDVQQNWLELWLETLIDTFPEIYRAAVAKFIQGAGVELETEEVARINATFLGKFGESVTELEALDDTGTLAGEGKNSIARAIGRASIEDEAAKYQRQSGNSAKNNDSSSTAASSPLSSALNEVSNTLLAQVNEAIGAGGTEVTTSTTQKSTTTTTEASSTAAAVAAAETTRELKQTEKATGKSVESSTEKPVEVEATSTTAKAVAVSTETTTETPSTSTSTTTTTTTTAAAADDATTITVEELVDESQDEDEESDDSESVTKQSRSDESASATETATQGLEIVEITTQFAEDEPVTSTSTSPPNTAG